MRRWLASPDASYPVYAPEGFDDIAAFVACAPRWWRRDCDDADPLDGLSGVLRAYQDEQGFGERLTEIRTNTASISTFRQRLFQWFNAFRAMKFIRFATERVYRKQPLVSAAIAVLECTPPRRFPTASVLRNCYACTVAWIGRDGLMKPSSGRLAANFSWWVDQTGSC